MPAGARSPARPGRPSSPRLRIRVTIAKSAVTNPKHPFVRPTKAHATYKANEQSKKGAGDEADQHSSGSRRGVGNHKYNKNFLRHNPNGLTKSKQAQHKSGSYIHLNPGVHANHKQVADSGAVDEGVADPGLDELHFVSSPVNAGKMEVLGKNKVRGSGDKPAPTAERPRQVMNFAAAASK
eukprot:SAG22_NODE_857_length_6837_cov_22.929059_5_plen_181_part_00